MNLIKLVIMSSALSMLTGCASPSLNAYKDTKPAFDIKTYFNGPIKAWGVVQDWRGQVVRRFDVTMVGQWTGDTGTLKEHFTYYDGKTQDRSWIIKKMPGWSY